MNRHSQTRWIAGAAALLAASAWLAQGSSLQIRNPALVSGPEILLRDLVHASSPLPEGWGDRVVMKSPLPGRPQQVTLQTVAYALQKYPDMSDTALRGDLNITIRRDGVPLDMRLVQEAISAYVDEDENWKDSTTQVECDVPRSPILVAPQGELSLRIEGVQPEGGHGDYYIFEVGIYINGQQDRVAPVRARVQALREFWVAASPLTRTHTLTAEDIRPRFLPADSARRGLIPVSDAITGFQLNRPMRLDQPISRHYLQQPICAERGEWITVIGQRGSLKIAMRAKALSDGRLGEKILCMNEQSKRRLLVQMVGSKQATIDFGATVLASH